MGVFRPYYFSRLPFFSNLWVQLLFLLLPPVSSQLLRAGKDVTRFLPSRMLTLLLFYYAPSNLVYALKPYSLRIGWTSNSI